MRRPALFTSDGAERTAFGDEFLARLCAGESGATEAVVRSFRMKQPELVSAPDHEVVELAIKILARAGKASKS